MYRLLLIFFLLVVAAHAADATVVLPPPHDLIDYSAGQLVFLFFIAGLLSIVAAPICILLWALFLFIVVKIAGLFGVTPMALVMKLAQRQMTGRGKGLVWQLAILICLPAGVLALWMAIWMFGLKYQAGSLLVMGSALGVVVAVGFVWAVKAILRRLKERMMMGGMPGMGGMGGLNPMQAQMMAEMMKMRDRK